MTLLVRRLSVECSWDALSIYDGAFASPASPLLSMATGALLTRTVVSSGSQVVLRFRSDLFLEYRGFTVDFVTSPCPFNCSGFGTCSASTASCQCAAGRAGAFCERPACPSNCSLRGTCDPALGLCVCNPGFSGAACEAADVAGAWRAWTVNPAESLSAASAADVLASASPLGRTGHCLVHSADGADIYMLLGRSLAAGLLNDVWVRKVTRAAAWEPLASAPGERPAARLMSACAMHLGSIFAVGGWLADYTGSSEIWQLDVATGAWSRLASDSYGTRGAAAVVVAVPTPTLYIFGGYIDATGLMSNALRTVNLASKAVTLITPASRSRPPGRAYHTLHAIPGGVNAAPMLICYGGTEMRRDASDQLWLFFTATARWVQLSTGPGTPPGRFAASVDWFPAAPSALADERQGPFLAVFGGRRTISTSSQSADVCFYDDAFVYNAGAHAWFALPSTGEPPGPRHLQAGVVARLNDSASGAVVPVFVVQGGMFGATLGDTRAVALAPSSYELASVVNGRCSAYVRCLDCTADSLCGWCTSSRTCLARRALALGSASCGAGAFRLANCTGIACSAFADCEDCVASASPTCTFVGGACVDRAPGVPAAVCPVICSAFDGLCSECLSVGAGTCGYCTGTEACAALGAACFGTTLTQTGACAAGCGTHPSCGACRSTGECLWCPSTGRCIHSFLHDVMSFYGECADWVSLSNTCPAGCAALSDCSSCTARPECGWCATTGVCLDGSFGGPALNGSCPPGEWDFTSCPCQSRGSSCAACVADARCGWCAVTGTCTRGTAAGPYGTPTQLLNCGPWDYGTCFECSMLNNSRACQANSLCGWCAARFECQRGGSLAPSTCATSPAGLGWYYNFTRNDTTLESCQRHTSCSACTSDPDCGYCASAGRCLPGDANGAFPLMAGAAPLCTLGAGDWDKTLCNSVCAFASSCSTCLDLGDTCGWCCETNSCVAGGCSTVEWSVCPNCSAISTCGACSANLCCGWCSIVYPGSAERDLSGHCMQAAAAELVFNGALTCGADKPETSLYVQGNCPIDCLQFTSCAACAVHPYCGWCDETAACLPGDQLGPLQPQPACSSWLHGACSLVMPYTLGASRSHRTLVQSRVLVIYGVSFFIGTLLGILVLIVLIRKVESCLSSEPPHALHAMQLQMARQMLLAEQQQQQRRPPLLTLLVPDIPGSEHDVVVPAGANAKLSLTARYVVRFPTDPFYSQCAVIRFPAPFDARNSVAVGGSDEPSEEDERAARVLKRRLPYLVLGSRPMVEAARPPTVAEPTVASATRADSPSAQSPAPAAAPGQASATSQVGSTPATAASAAAPAPASREAPVDDVGAAGDASQAVVLEDLPRGSSATPASAAPAAAVVRSAWISVDESKDPLASHSASGNESSSGDAPAALRSFVTGTDDGSAGHL